MSKEMQQRYHENWFCSWVVHSERKKQGIIVGKLDDQRCFRCQTRMALYTVSVEQVASTSFNRPAQNVGFIRQTFSHIQRCWGLYGIICPLCLDFVALHLDPWVVFSLHQ